MKNTVLLLRNSTLDLIALINKKSQFENVAEINGHAIDLISKLRQSTNANQIKAIKTIKVTDCPIPLLLRATFSGPQRSVDKRQITCELKFKNGKELLFKPETILNDIIENKILGVEK